MNIDRLQEVINTLNAYRQGWIPMDREHIRELQKERLELEARERETNRVEALRHDFDFIN